MIEARIHWIDVKNSTEKAYASVSYEDVTFSTVTDEFGEQSEICTLNSVICEREYEFAQPIEEQTITTFIESERAKL